MFSSTGNYWLAFLIVPVIGLVLGALVERSVIQPIRGTAALSIAATFGLSIIIQETVRATFGAAPKRILPPIEGTVPLFGIEYDVYRIFAAPGLNSRHSRVFPVPASHEDRHLDARGPI